MARKKRRRRVGHITDVERRAISDAIAKGWQVCYDNYQSGKGYRVCTAAVAKVRDELQKTRL